jgi:hypothetical protein
MTLDLGDRTPEVVIKVISPGSNSLAAVRWHIKDISNGKHRMLETDYGELVANKAEAIRLVEDWDLDLDELIGRVYFPLRRKPLKLVHKIVFSMPAGTLPEKLLAAVRGFAQEELAPGHRYALALHTDEPHPHVHVLMTAMNFDCVRLNIRKSTLHKWRQSFVRHLRAQGVAAKATRRAARNYVKRIKLPGMQRPTTGLCSAAPRRKAA